MYLNFSAIVLIILVHSKVDGGHIWPLPRFYDSQVKIYKQTLRNSFKPALSSPVITRMYIRERERERERERDRERQIEIERERERDRDRERKRERDRERKIDR